ncbi:MFS general substrate transporter [Acephala macrosclerotiorum]|nr:MFS general substrate transporter [Acephala macrosclerotiorum]
MSIWWKGYQGRRAYEDLLEGDPVNYQKKTLVLVAANFDLQQNNETLKKNLLEIIEPNGFKWRVFLVASSGFLADSYAMFSTNVVSPALAYIYWQSDTNGTKGLVINVVTLSGSCIGMALFGILADSFGRKRLYGLELVIGIVATLGLTQVSAGYNQESMNPFAWIVWWRFVLGIAIGAEHPLSALIAAEWSATRTRGTMLAAVFLMQPIGQFLAYIIGYASLRGIFHDRLPNWSPDGWDNSDSKVEGTVAIDAVWRCVIGVGAFPALVAIALRLTIPETPRFLIDVKEDLPAAAQATRRVFPNKKKTPSRQNSDKKFAAESDTALASKTKNIPVVQSSSVDIVGAELKQRNPGSLPGTAICWFIMDVCFYGLGLDTPRTLAKIFGSRPSDVTPKVYDWNAGFAEQDDNIYDALYGDATRALYTIPLSAIPGSVVFLLLVNYIPRVTVLRLTFVVLAILFAITGSSLVAVFETSNHSLTIVFYAFSLFILNVGPNTILFMLPAELFPTRYRGTCYGIAAASGKAGAIIIQLIVHFQRITRPSSDKMKLAIMLMCFTPLTLVGAFVAWVWIPEVQHLRDLKSVGGQQNGTPKFRERMMMPPRSLEEITVNPTEGQIFGLRDHLSHLFGRGAKTTDSSV